MSVNLQKGEKISLSKSQAGLKSVVVGLGWDAIKKKGFFSRQQEIDCDASVILIGSKGVMENKDDVVFYNNLRHKSGAIIHQGDNLTGDGDGDDEQVMVLLDKLPLSYEKLVFVVTIYQSVQRNQHFGLIENAFIRIVNADNNQELCKFNLSDNYDGKTSMIFGELYRNNGEWKFNAIGEGTKDDGISQITNRFL